MPGRMGGNLSTAQSLRILKIDPHANLIFVAGAVAGPELGIVRITDAVRKLQNGKCFPTTTTTANGSGGSDFIVPYPTFMGNVADLPNELLPPLPEGKAALALDPFLKQVNEI